MTWICIRFAWREIGELWQTKNNIRLTIRHTRNPNHLLLNGNDAGSYCILHMLQCFLFWVVRHLQRAITRFPFIIIHVIISGGALHVCFPQVNQQEKKKGSNCQRIDTSYSLTSCRTMHPRVNRIPLNHSKLNRQTSI